MTPTRRSIAHFRLLGCLVERVEQRLPIPGKFVTRDTFGVGDLLVADPINRWIGLVQVTSMANLAAREKKARVEPRLHDWLAAGGRFLLHGWAKRGPRGKRKTWQITEREITA